MTSNADVIYHPRYRITLERGSSLVPGAIGRAVSLRGIGQYVDLGDHMDKCFANIELCQHGLTIAMLLKPESLKSNQYYLSGPTYNVYLENGQLKADFFSSGKTWNVSSERFSHTDWNNIVLSWKQEDGLELYVDNKLVSSNRVAGDMEMNDAQSSRKLYLGRNANTAVQDTAVMMADEVQFWYANLDTLKLRGLFKGRNRFANSILYFPNCFNNNYDDELQLLHNREK